MQAFLDFYTSPGQMSPERICPEEMKLKEMVPSSKSVKWVISNLPPTLVPLDK